MLLRLWAISLLAVVTMSRAEIRAQETAKDKPAAPTFLRGDHHLVFRVETELQRLLIRPLEAKIVVVIDGERLREPEDVDEALIEAIRRDLAGFAKREEAVHFILFFGKDSAQIDPQGMKAALARAVDALDLAYYPSRMSSTYDHKTWRERIASVDEDAGAAKRDESGIGDEAIKAYPVRTPLGGYLAEGTDCVIDLSPAVTEVNQAAIVDAIRADVSKLGLGKKRNFLVRFYKPPAQDPSKDLDRISKDLGFQHFAWSCCAE